MQALKSIKVFFRHRNSLQLHFGHIWLMHFAHASGFLRLCHAFFGWGFISKCGAYQWSSSFGRCPSYFGHFVFMCSSSTFLFHTNDTSSFSLSIFLGGFWQNSYGGMWGHYGSKIVGVFLRPFSEASGLTIDILWWYRPSLYGGLCPIYFYNELGSGGFVFVL